MDVQPFPCFAQRSVLWPYNQPAALEHLTPSSQTHSCGHNFRQSEPKSFKGTDIATTDFACDQLVLFQPASLSNPQRLRIEKCWFDGLTDEERIRAEMLRDAGNDPESGVLASLFKPQEQALGFGGRP